MSDRLSRADRRNLQRQDALYLSKPLQMGSDPRSIAAHIRHVVHTLRAPTSKSPIIDAISHVLALHDRTVPREVDKMIACRKGCLHCCSQMVILSAPEAFYVARQLRNRPDTAAAIEAISRETGSLTLEQRLGRNIFCPLLSDAICSIYNARPLGCRGFISTSLDQCLAAFVRGEEPNIPMPTDAISILYAHRMLLIAALRLAGLNDANYEMNSAVAVVLTTPDAERRWLAGENIFAQIPAGEPPPPQFEQSIRQLMAYVAPTV